jgi:hypothetical protein
VRCFAIRAGSNRHAGIMRKDCRSKPEEAILAASG